MVADFTCVNNYLDEHHEGAGEKGHVDQGAEGDQPPQRRAFGQERLLRGMGGL